MKKDIIKAAIARIFMAIINADGIISTKELEFLDNKIKPNYFLDNVDFDKAKALTYAEAINLIKEGGGIKKTDIDEILITKRNDFLLEVEKDMELMSTVDGNRDTKEALLCLAYRYVVDNDSKIVSCDKDMLKFSPNEIIYVESDYDINVNKTIEENYYTICYMMQSFGYQFIYIPRTQRIIQEYDATYKKEIIKYLYPHIDANKMYQSFVNRLDNVTTSDFTKMLFSKTNDVITPSLLLKIDSTRFFNKNNQIDFLLINIKKEGIIKSIELFLKKLDDLCDENSVHVLRGLHSLDFDKKSFHNTFVEYIKNKADEIEIHIDKNNKKYYIHFCGCGVNVNIPPKSLSLYITMLYCAMEGCCFTKKAVSRTKDNRNKQYNIFYNIYNHICGDEIKNDANRLKNDGAKQILSEDCFYDSIQTDYDKLIKPFEKLEEKYLKIYAPIYDKVEQSYYFAELLPAKIFLYNPSFIYYSFNFI